jgi:hypothetical protein
MPKRGRDGSVMIHSNNIHFPRSLKRPAGWEIDQMPDLKRFQASMSVPEPLKILKRPADFDIEFQHLNKRLRATIPTAEEAIAFLLPHIEKLRQLYMQEKGKCNLFENRCCQLSSALSTSETTKKKLFETVCQTICEKDQLERELNMTKYRLALTDKKTFSGII